MLLVTFGNIVAHFLQIQVPQPHGKRLSKPETCMNHDLENEPFGPKTVFLGMMKKNISLFQGKRVGFIHVSAFFGRQQFFQKPPCGIRFNHPVIDRLFENSA